MVGLFRYSFEYVYTHLRIYVALYSLINYQQMEYKYFQPVRLIKVKKPFWLKLRNCLKDIKNNIVNLFE